jgi:uncharacterized Tic20 family protein
MKRLMQDMLLCFFMWLMLVSSLVGPSAVWDRNRLTWAVCKVIRSQ